MQFLLLALQPRFLLLTASAVASVVLLAMMISNSNLQAYLVAPLAGSVALVVLGLRDLTQTKHAILRNYPIAARLRFLLENIRPEMRQYFFEGEKDGTPFPRDKRAIV
ncbi:MAG: FMN-binding glutamate synthase family protein, partial [Nitrospira sp.]